DSSSCVMVVFSLLLKKKYAQSRLTDSRYLMTWPDATDLPDPGGPLSHRNRGVDLVGPAAIALTAGLPSSTSHSSQSWKDVSPVSHSHDPVCSLSSIRMKSPSGRSATSKACAICFICARWFSTFSATTVCVSATVGISCSLFSPPFYLQFLNIS